MRGQSRIDNAVTHVDQVEKKDTDEHVHVHVVPPPVPVARVVVSNGARLTGMEGPGKPRDHYEGKTGCDEPGKTALHQEEEQGYRYENSPNGAGKKGKGDEERQKELVLDAMCLVFDIPFQGQEGRAKKECKGHLRKEQRAVVEKGMG